MAESEVKAPATEKDSQKAGASTSTVTEEKPTTSQDPFEDVNVLSEDFYRYPSDIISLMEHGCYYFRLAFAPDYQFQSSKHPGIPDAMIDINKLNTNDISSFFSDSIQKITPGKANNELELIVNTPLQQYAFQAAGLAFQNAAAKAGSSQIANFRDQSMSQNETKYSYAPLYQKQAMHVGHIFLPLSSMKISRRAGIVAQQNVYTSAKQSMAAQARKEYEESYGGVPGSIAKAGGMSENPFYGHVANNVEFDKFDIEWELLPRNPEEMAQILKIITFIQSVSLSNMDLNDKTIGKWILPPQVDMGIITTSISPNDIKSPEIKELIQDRSTSFSAIFQESIIGKEEAFKKSYKQLSDNATKVNAFWLKPKTRVFVDNVEIEPLENKGGVLLSAEGLPLGIRLRVNLVRVALSTVADLFRSKNTLDGKDNTLSSPNKINKANPFA